MRKHAETFQTYKGYKLAMVVFVNTPKFSK